MLIFLYYELCNIINYSDILNMLDIQRVDMKDDF